MVKDYDQFLSKFPNRPTAVFPWHQDMQYWPKCFPKQVSTRTATFSLALSDAGPEQGCLMVVPGSHKSKQVRETRAGGETNQKRDQIGDDRAVEMDLAEGECVVELPVKRGDVTVRVPLFQTHPSA